MQIHARTDAPTAFRNIRPGGAFLVDEAVYVKMDNFTFSNLETGEVRLWVGDFNREVVPASLTVAAIAQVV